MGTSKQLRKKIFVCGVLGMSNLAVLLSSYVDFQKYSCIMILSKATILVKIPPNAWGFQLPPVFLFQVVDECIIIPCIVLSLKNTRDAQRNVLARYGRRTVLVFIQGERDLANGTRTSDTWRQTYLIYGKIRNLKFG